MDTEQFEQLLREDKDNTQRRFELQKASYKKHPERAQADKSADLRDFIEMVAKVVSLAMKDLEVEFVPDEGRRIKIDPDAELDHPYIFYKVESREVKDEKKPRVRETITEKTHDGREAREGKIFGQKFKCYVQFDIIAGEYSTADEVMYTFEDVLFRYTHYFKKNGVAELLFHKHHTDENHDVYRQYVSVRSIQYYVEVEKLITMFGSEIEDVEII